MIPREWIEEKLKNCNPFREDKWIKSIAVDEEVFVEEIQRGLEAKAVGRSILPDNEQHQLREVQQSYMAHFGLEKTRLRLKNRLKWNVCHDI